MAWSSGAAASKPSSRRPSVVARSKRKPSTPTTGVVAKHVEREPQRRRPVERQRVAAAGVVDVARAVVGERPVVGRVVESAQRQRRTERVALAGVVEDDVEDGFDAGRMQRGHRPRDVVDAAGREPRIGNERRHGVVAPVVVEAERGQVPLADPRGDRHQFDRRDAEAGQVRERGGMRETPERAAQRFRHVGMGAGEAAHVELVDHRVGPRHARTTTSRATGRRVTIPFGTNGRAVGVVARRRLVAAADHGRMRRRTAGRAPARTDRPEASPD